MHEQRVVKTDVAERLRALDGFPLLETVDEQQRVQFAANGVVLAFEDGDAIVQEGERGVAFYIVLEGSARVQRGDDVLARLGAGDFFGETSLLEWKPRNATVVAEGRVVCMAILEGFFKAFLAANPTVAMTVLEEEARRLGR